MGVMVGLPTVGRHQTPGEQPAHEACELLPLAGGEKIPKRRSRRGRARPIQGRGGTDPDMCLHMGKLLGVGSAAATIGPGGRAVPRRSLRPADDPDLRPAAAQGHAKYRGADLDLMDLHSSEEEGGRNEKSSY